MHEHHQFLDQIEGHVVASACPIRLGRHARVVVAPGVVAQVAPPELFERAEIHLEDIVLEVRSTNVPVTVGLGAVVYLHPGASVQRVTEGGSVYLSKGAWVEELDEVGLARGEFTVATWMVSSPRRAVG